MITDQEWQRAIDKSEYQSVIGPDEYTPEPLAKALDNVYIAVEKNVESDVLYERTAEVPAQYARGKLNAREAERIISDVQDICSGIEEVEEACEESLEYLE